MNARTDNEKENEHHQTSCFSRIGKSLRLIVKTMCFECLAGCVRERKRYQTNINNAIKIHTKTMNNQCTFYVRQGMQQI